MKIFIYSTYPFLLQPRLLPTEPPFNQSHFFWKNNVKHTAVDITYFFQDLKPPPGRDKKCFLEAPYGTSQTSKL